MRSLLTLSSLALLGLLAAPGTAGAATPCEPSAPLNGAFCAGELCSQVGVTTYDKDGQTPIACAYDAVFNRNIWKPMSAGVGLVGGGSYTAYGTTNCAAGYYAAYTGTLVLAGNYANYGYGIFCKEGGVLPPNLPSGAPLFTSGRGQFSEGPFSCAVCVK